MYQSKIKKVKNTIYSSAERVYTTRYSGIHVLNNYFTRLSGGRKNPSKAKFF